MKRALLLALFACGTQPSRLDPLLDGTAPTAAAEPELRGAPPVPRPPFDVPPPSDKVLAIARPSAIYSFHEVAATCVLRASGRVDCWGPRDRGLARSEPYARETIAGAVALSPRADCVLLPNGDVKGKACAEPFTDVAAFGTGELPCVVFRNGTVSCGKERGGVIPGVTDAVAVASSSDNLVCAIRKQGEVACTRVAYDEPPPPMKPLVGLAGVSRLVLANRDGCAILGSGNVQCFAVAVQDSGFSLDILDGAALPSSKFAGATDLALEHVSSPGGASRVLLLHAIVGGKVLQFRPESGEVTTLPSLVDAVQLTHGCALRRSGAVACWGSNAGGALGQPTTIGRVRRPVAPVVGLSDVSTIALGGVESWALTNDGTWMHWGKYGEAFPTAVPLPRDAGRVVAIAATRDGGGCALTEHGAVWCRKPDREVAKVFERGVRSISGAWLSVHALHDDGTISSTAFDPKYDERERLTAPAGAVSLVRSDIYPCVLAAEQRLHCYDGLDKQWKAIHDATGAARVAGGDDGCAIAPGGQVFCWRDVYQKGIEKLPAPSIADAVDIAVSSDQACVVRRAGQVTCWYLRIPERTRDVIAGGAFAVALGHPFPETYDSPGARNMHGCAIMRNRTLACWGSNFGGQLGDGSIARSDAPVGVRL